MISTRVHIFLILNAMMGVVNADMRLIDPQIPDGEKIEYYVKVGEEISRKIDRTSIIHQGGEKYYEFNSKSPELDMVVRIKKDSMAVINTTVLSKGEYAQVRRRTELVAKTGNLADDEIGLPDFFAINYLLRGYPFEHREPAKLKVLGQRSSFSLQIRSLGKETVSLGSAERMAYKLELRMSGFIGRLFPKTRLWYSTDKPHYLIRYEGPSAGPGSPTRTVELTNYSVTK